MAQKPNGTGAESAVLIAEGLKIEHLASCMFRAVGVMQYAVGTASSMKRAECRLLGISLASEALKHLKPAFTPGAPCSRGVVDYATSQATTLIDMQLLDYP